MILKASGVVGQIVRRWLERFKSWSGITRSKIGLPVVVIRQPAVRSRSGSGSLLNLGHCPPACRNGAGAGVLVIPDGGGREAEGVNRARVPHIP